MGLEKTVTEHGKQIDKHTERLNDVEKDVQELKQDLRVGLDRVDQSNRYLREQNNVILKEVITKNKTSEQHDFALTKLAKDNQIKMFGMIFGTGGVIVLIINLLMKLFH